MQSMELTNFLEHIRLGRGISQENFVDGICSIRQYQRYRNGDSAIPYERVEMFAEKLGIPSKKLLNHFEHSKNEQFLLVNEYYNAAVDNDQKQLKQLKYRLNQDILIEEETLVFYKHAMIFEIYQKNTISKAEAIRQNMELINYPDILKQEFVTDIEVLILSSFVDFEDVPKFDVLLKRLDELFETTANIFSGDNIMIILLILMRLARGHGIQGNHERVIGFCDKALEVGRNHQTYYLFVYFYYFKALAHFELEQYLEYEDALFHCFNAIQIEDDDETREHFTKLIEEDFGIDFRGFILHYLHKFDR